MNTHDIELPEHWQAFQYNEGWGSWEQVIPSAANKPGVVKAYTADQVVAAIEADRKRRGEPDAVAACHAVRPYIDSIVCYASTVDEHDGNRVAKMVEDVCAAHPQPAEPVAWPKVNGVGRVIGSEQSLEVYFDSEPTDDQLRAIHDALRQTPQPAEPVDKSKNLQGSPVDKSTKMQGQPAEPRLDAPAQVGHTRFGEGVPWSTVIGAAQRYYAAQNAKEQERLQRAAENIKALHQAEPVNQHSDDTAVDAFAAAMKAKLAKKRAEGRGGWQTCSAEYLSRLLREHVEKGDPVDVANLAMMLHQNGQGIAPAEPVKGQTGKTVLQSSQSLNTPVEVPVIEPSDLRIETYPAEPHSAWVVKADTGVRVTHVPTGLSAACNEDRSVHRNRVLAMEKLQKMLQTRALFAGYRNSDIGQSVETLKLLSDDEIISLALQHCDATDASGEEARLTKKHSIIAFARAILARYDNKAGES